MLRIVNWDSNFENGVSRRLKRLDWVAMPVKMTGSGYMALVDHASGAAHFGAWVAIVEASAVQEVRGMLPKAAGRDPHDVPGICRSLARISRIPAAVFDELIPRLLGDEIAWLEMVDEHGVELVAAQQLANRAVDPEPTPIVRRPALYSNAKPSDRFQEFWAKYPRQVGQESAGMDWVSYVTDQNEAAVFACLERYLLSREVATGAVQNAGSTPQKLGWIASCAKDNWQCTWPVAGQERGRRQEETDQAWGGARANVR